MTRMVLDPDLKPDNVIEFEDEMTSRVIGQDGAIEALARLYGLACAGLTDPTRPIGSIMLVGHTGVGKTRIAEAACESLFGDHEFLTKIDCAEFQHDHEISKLIGAPPGSTGHRVTTPILFQEYLDRSHTPRQKLSLILFDEIEKAHEALFNLLLGVLDRASLTLGDNSRVDFSRCIFIFTGNVGSRELAALRDGKTIGFSPNRGRRTNRIHSQEIVTKALQRKFSPEFLNRLTEVVVVNELSETQLRKILNTEIRAEVARITTTCQIKIGLTLAAKQFLFEQGFNPEYGARPLKRALERHFTLPVANLISTGQIGDGETLICDRVEGIPGLAFGFFTYNVGLLDQVRIENLASLARAHYQFKLNPLAFGYTAEAGTD